MEEDPFSQLLRQHFMKVSECLENHVNFDKLTRYSLSSSSEKVIDNTEYGFPELEYRFEKSEDKTTSNFNISSLRDSQSVIVEEEIDIDITEKNITDPTILSVVDSIKEPEAKIMDNENEISLYDKFRTAPIHEKSESPTLSMYDFDESEACSLHSIPTVRKIETSKKFIHSGSAPILNGSMSSSEDQIVLSISNFDDLDDGIVHSTIFDSVHSNEFLKSSENERSFEDELEQYKKDIKVEKAIKSLSVNDTVPRVHGQSKHNIITCDSCSKALKREKPMDETRLPIFDEFSDHTRTFGSDIVQPPPNFANTAEYLKYLLEDSNTTVYHGLMNSKSSSNFDLSQHKFNPIMDDDMIESVLTKFMKSQLNIGKSNNPSYPESLRFGKENGRNVEIPSAKTKFESRRYVKMNHLEIQKELTRRIEDMYKAGDGN
ncbi:hypothetical protein WA026_002136 [Henosepilachna vigintioctopunctata]|uniref:Uncharacterized protein n=1 Tax=Henosepilachna vigintioctopunctata TaxID=420089 RepID=A0AAW1TYX0_9CUCU